MDAPALAARWWGEHHRLAPVSSRGAVLESFADRCFSCQDFVFSLDAYAQAFEIRKADSSTSKKNAPTISFSFAHNYLHSTLQVQDPTTNFRWERQQLAWELVRCVFSREHPDRFGDERYYQLRDVYFFSFRSIYNAVFAWEDAPALALAQWWHACCKKRREALEKQTAERKQRRDPRTEKSSPYRRRTRTTKKSQSSSPKTRSRATPRPAVVEQRSPPPSLSSTTALKASPNRGKMTKRALIRNDETEGTRLSGSEMQMPNQVEEGCVDSSSATESMRAPANQHRFGCHEPVTAGKHRGAATRGGFYENSPTKRKLSAVRYGCNNLSPLYQSHIKLTNAQASSQAAACG